jgi:probable rRNA maturation factor
MNPKELLCRIQVVSKQRRYRIYRDSVALFCDAILQSMGKPNQALSIAFVTSREIQSLNSRYLQRNYATDVLSFSYGKVKMDRMPFLGEVIIAPEVAVNGATRKKISPEEELKRILIHGILHLLSYDHETDQGQMNRLQKRLLRRKFSANAPPLADLKVDR